MKLSLTFMFPLSLLHLLLLLLLLHLRLFLLLLHLFLFLLLLFLFLLLLLLLLLHLLHPLLPQATYINGSPQNTFVPGVVELAQQKKVFLAGDDFKSGQTKIKSVLVDFLVSAGIKVSYVLCMLSRIQCDLPAFCSSH